MMTQLNIKDGRKAYGNKGDEAVLKEIKQLQKTCMVQQTWQSNVIFTT